MFFSIGLDKDSRFPVHYKINAGFFSCDNGWNFQSTNGKIIIYKGYAEEGVVDQLINDPTPRLHGNFCLVISDHEKTTVTHDINRSFPLYWLPDQKILTNLTIESNDLIINVYADRYVILDKNLNYYETFFDCYGKIDLTPIDTDQCIDQIIQILTNTSMININCPLNLFLTGGVDSSLVGALLHRQKIPHNLIEYEHFDYDNFTYKNIENIKNHHWGYQQMHHWITPSALASGSYGDVIFLRSLNTVALWAAWHNIDLVTLLKQHPDSYHYHYFLKNKQILIDAWQRRQDIQQLTPVELVQQILNITINDHQHWHLGNTLTITPLKNLEITKLLLRLPTQVLVTQILNADISKELIRQIDPTFLKYVAPYKNYCNLLVLSHDPA